THITAPSSSAILAVDKGKAPMVDDFIPADLLNEQQENLAQKAQAKSVASLAAQGTGLSAQRQRELDAAQLIYTEADWLELMAKIATNSALSKQLLGDDVNEDNMNERLGMLLMRKRRELVEQSQVPAGVLAAPSFAADVSVFAISSTTADVSAAPTTTTSIAGGPSPSVAENPTTHTQVPPVTTDVAGVFAHADTEVHANESRPDDKKTTSEQVFAEHTVDTSTTFASTYGVSHATPLSSRKRCKQLAKKRVTPHLMHLMPAGKWRLLGDVDKFYQTQEPETFALILRGDLRVLFHSPADEDAHAFWRDQESWRICSWRLYPRPHFHVLKTVDGRVIYMFVDVSYPHSEATLEHMLRHGLEVPKLLVGGDLTMAEQLVSFIKAALLTAQSAV
nr:aminoacyl-tRNA synthetase, class 1a, anticodon-binding [Tanacetum cinerariifolium]